MSSSLDFTDPSIDFESEDIDYGELIDENFADLTEGELVKGIVTKMNNDFVSVDVKYKSEGQIPIEEFYKDGELAVEIGDEVEIYLERLENEKGQILLSKDKANKLKVWAEVNQKAKEDQTVTGTITAKVKGGLSVDIGVKAFLPGSQIDLRAIRNLDALIGETHEFKVLKINQKRGNIVLSRRALLEIDREDKRKKTIELLKPDTVIQGHVKNITDYGIFVDLGGIDGLLHITDMTWGRINHPSEMYNVGDEIEVLVLSYDEEGEKVSLGLKQKSKNPWDNIMEKYPPGTKVEGKIVSLTNYGAFIEVEAGIEGLIHISEMSWTKKVKQPSSVVQIGDKVEAVIKEIDTERRRISLSMKDILPNPWFEIQEKMPEGSVVRGTVRNITEFGVFVALEGGIDGLVYVSDISWSQRTKQPDKLFKKGDEIDVKILSIDPEKGRLSLGIKQLTEDPWENLDQKISEGDVISGTVVHIADFGVFVEIKEGVEGLIHISEIGKNMNKKTLSEKLPQGKEIYTRVTKLDIEERRLSLVVLEEELKKGLEEDNEQKSAEKSEDSAKLADEVSEEVKAPESSEPSEDKSEPEEPSDSEKE